MYVLTLIGSRPDLISLPLLILLFLFLLFLLERPSSNKPRLRLYNLDRNEIWQKRSSSKYASTEEVGCLI